MCVRSRIPGPLAGPGPHSTSQRYTSWVTINYILSYQIKYETSIKILDRPVSQELKSSEHNPLNLRLRGPWLHPAFYRGCIKNPYLLENINKYNNNKNNSIITSGRWVTQKTQQLSEILKDFNYTKKPQNKNNSETQKYTW